MAAFYKFLTKFSVFQRKTLGFPFSNGKLWVFHFPTENCGCLNDERQRAGVNNSCSEPNYAIVTNSLMICWKEYRRGQCGVSHTRMTSLLIFISFGWLVVLGLTAL